MIEIFIVIKEGDHQYYLLKVQRCGFDIYCIPPALGLHYSLHESGESHFKSEGKSKKPREELPVALLMGEAGTPTKNGVRSISLRGLGRAACICNALFPTSSLSHDFRKFDQRLDACFVIDTELFPKDIKGVQVGIWAVPARNKASFESNYPTFPKDFLYKVTQCEPQIWIYACPFQ